LKSELLQLLRCIDCGETDISLAAHAQSDVEVRQGVLACQRCGATAPIKEGVADFVHASDEWIAVEQQYTERVFRERIEELGSIEAAEAVRKEQAVGRDEPTFYDLWSRDMMRQAVERLNPQPGQTVLEIGGATGRDLCDRFAARGCLGIVVDISLELDVMSDYVMEDRGLYYERVRASFTRLPFADSTMDVVFSSACLHHGDDPTDAIREVRRVLKADGVFAMLNERVVSRLLPQLKGEVAEEYEDAHESAYFFSEWTDMLRNGGFGAVEVLRPRFMTARRRYRARFADYRPGTRKGWLLRCYMYSRTITERIPVISSIIAWATFLYERELIGDVSYSCIARHRSRH
jgi:ubiquinone/menaquinone biosynthesis C-methylase UbiE/uncharacterized protein YbaR (Trm112 family)